MPGPISTWDANYEVDDGTSCRMPSRSPGPTEHRLPSMLARAEALYEAYERAQVLAPAAVLQKTGYALGSLLKGLLPGLLQTLIILAAGTVLGAVAGGVIGFFFAGAGAAPGAVLGGELGLEIGTAILSWLGLAFLAVAIVQGFGELWSELSAGVKRAWAAPEYPDREYPHQIEKAAHDFANAAGILLLLILQGVVAWVFKRAAVGATKAALARGNSIRAAGSEAAAGEAVGAVVAQLRASRLGSGFADWVEENWPRLRDDPRLRFKVRTTGVRAPAETGSEISAKQSGGTSARTQEASKALVPYYPPNQGVIGTARPTTLLPGQVLDRYGGPQGSFLSPAGTPAWQRSLPFGADGRPLNVYQVVKPIDVNEGTAAPWFGQLGGGTQYDLGTKTVQDLIDSGHLKPVEKP